MEGEGPRRLEMHFQGLMGNSTSRGEQCVQRPQDSKAAQCPSIHPLEQPSSKHVSPSPSAQLAQAEFITPPSSTCTQAPICTLASRDTAIQQSPPLLCWNASCPLFPWPTCSLSLSPVLPASGTVSCQKGSSGCVILLPKSSGAPGGNDSLAS